LQKIWLNVSSLNVAKFVKIFFQIFEFCVNFSIFSRTFGISFSVYTSDVKWPWKVYQLYRNQVKMRPEWKRGRKWGRKSLIFSADSRFLKLKKLGRQHVCTLAQIITKIYFSGRIWWIIKMLLALSNWRLLFLEMVKNYIKS